jgi:hypothetical protein
MRKSSSFKVFVCGFSGLGASVAHRGQEAFSGYLIKILNAYQSYYFLVRREPPFHTLSTVIFKRAFPDLGLPPLSVPPQKEDLDRNAGESCFQRKVI